MKILLTAFDPFGGASINPAWEAVSRVADRIGPAEVHKLMVPTVFGKAENAVNSLADQLDADAVICVGQAGGCYEITLERIAVNFDDASIPDNEGNQPLDQRITPGGANAYFSSLPVKEITAALRKAGIPAALSLSAGTYVCNHLFYRVMEEIHLHHPERIGGFIHVPYLPEQTVSRSHTPSMSLDLMIRALETAVRITAETIAETSAVQ